MENLGNGIKMYKLFNKTSRRSVKNTSTNRVQKFKTEKQALKTKKGFSPNTRKNLEVKKISSVKRRTRNPFSFW